MAKEGRPKFNPRPGRGLNPGPSGWQSEIILTVPTSHTFRVDIGADVHSCVRNSDGISVGVDNHVIIATDADTDGAIDIDTDVGININPRTSRGEGVKLPPIGLSDLKLEAFSQSK